MRKSKRLLVSREALITSGASAPTTLKTGVGKRRDLTDTALYQEVSHEQEVYRPTFG